jgi:hypothetical protein
MATYDLPRIKHDGLREIVCGPYTLVRYKKPLMDESLAKYRSVVYKGDQLVAFSPPRSTSFTAFEKQCPTPENAVVREFVDGMMIYVWYADEHWHTSTRSSVDADKVYRRGTNPVARLQETTDCSEPPTPKELFQLYVEQFPFEFYETLDKTNTYVFSLMHPTSFNVVKPSGLECYLTNVYKILEGNQVQSVELDGSIDAPIKTPTVQLFERYTDIQDYMAGKDYSVKGFMVYDPATDQRLKILNPRFLKVHMLLSSKPNLNEIILEALLVHKNAGELALLHEDYPKQIDALERNILRCANLLYGYYLECFVKKTKAHKDFPVLYRSHMYELHKTYLQSFRTLGFRMNKSVVLDYVKNLPVPILCPLLGVH